MDALVPYLPHANASLNAVATILLLVGYGLIKSRREVAHKWTMLAALAVSMLFLASYLLYHARAGSRPFPEDAHPAVRRVYFAVLTTHVVLAAVVPLLVVLTVYLGLRDRRTAHRRLARWTFPIWLYVSLTGVLVYLMLYQIYT